MPLISITTLKCIYCIHGSQFLVILLIFADLLRMNKKVVVDPYYVACEATIFASSLAQSPNASFSGTVKASLSSSAEVKYLHPLIEVEASKGSESRHTMRIYETKEYAGFLQEKETLLANAAAAAPRYEHQACRLTEECWNCFAVGLRDSRELCKNCRSPIHKRRRLN